jgi:hypothetical protein
LEWFSGGTQRGENSGKLPNNNKKRKKRRNRDKN